MVVDLKELNKIVKQKLSKISWIEPGTPAVLLLPDSRVFHASALFPSSLKGDELRKAVLERTQKEIPLPFANAQVALSQGEKKGDKLRTTVYAVEKKVLSGFRQMFEATSLFVTTAEANSQSTYRCIQKYCGSELKASLNSSDAVMIADLGSHWLNVSVYTSSGACLYTRSIPYKQFVRSKNLSTKLSQEIVDRIPGFVQEIVLHFMQEGLSIQHVLFSGVEAWDERLLSKTSTEEKQISFMRVGDVLKIDALEPKDIHTFGVSIGAGLRAAAPLAQNNQHNLLS